MYLLGRVLLSFVKYRLVVSGDQGTDRVTGTQLADIQISIQKINPITCNGQAISKQNISGKTEITGNKANMVKKQKNLLQKMLS